MTNVISFPDVPDHQVERAYDAVMQALNENCDGLSMAAVIGVLELVKARVISEVDLS